MNVDKKVQDFLKAVHDQVEYSITIQDFPSKTEK